MKINYNINLIIMGNLEFFEYKYKLKTPALVVNSTLTTRTVIYIIIQKNKTIYGVGEVAPLPGLSTDKLEDIVPILKILSHQKIEINDTYFNKLYKTYTQFPSLLFALQSAFLMINKKENLTPIKTHYFATSLSNINNLGHNLIKYKIGLQNTDIDLININKLISKKPKIKFRFDVNKRFSLQESCNFFNKINKKNIDYVEDPCEETDLEEFYIKTGINYALDCPKQKPNNQLSYLGLSTLIIKPTIIGTINNIIKLKNSYKINRLILSSSYESKIGLNGLANYAQNLDPTEHHGINTEHFFEYNDTPNLINKFQPSSKTTLKNWILKQC